MKILITGGHMSPALAVIDYILKNNSDIIIVFVGRKYTEGNLSLEFKEITRKNIKFIDLDTGRLTRLMSFKTVINLIKIPLGLFRSWKIIKDEQPSVVLSFGGYLAFPITLTARLHNIPVYTHEQTVRPGLANRAIGCFAQKIFVSFEQSKKYFDSKKVVATGNPIRFSVTNINKTPFKIEKNLPVIYITGGTLGSHSINEHIKDILPDLLKKYIIIHQTGDSHQYRDYDKLVKFRQSLNPDRQENYYLVKHFTNEEIGHIYSICDLVIGRAGANTFFELIALKKPAILIPLPWSANNEQEFHAKIFEENHLGAVFRQNEPSKKLLDLIDIIINDIDNYKKNFDKQSLINHKYAVEKIYHEIFPKF